MSNKKKLGAVLKKINKGVKSAESYNTGLVAEKLIVASYDSMQIAQLEKLRYILKKIIKKKKILKRINKQKKENGHNN